MTPAARIRNAMDRVFVHRLVVACKLTAKITLVAGVSLLSGCSSSSGGGRKGFDYRQDAAFARDLEPEHIRAYDNIGKRAGLGDAYAAKWRVVAKYCPPSGHAEPFGPYSCDANCLGWAGCAHATAGVVGSYSAVHTYAGQPRSSTIAHECMHPIIQQEAEDPPEVKDANNGHPTHATFRGRVHRIKDLLEPGTRWPLLLRPFQIAINAAGRAVNWGNDEWGQECPHFATPNQEETE
jgi:hypothetical protein